MAVAAVSAHRRPLNKFHKNHVTARSVFLKELTKGLSISHAARTANVERRMFYVWRGTTNQESEIVAGFGDAWDEAVQIGIDRLEDEAFRRAHDGVDKPVFYQGEMVATIKEYSDNLLKFLMEGRRSEVYRPRAENLESQNVTVVVTGGLPSPKAPDA